jgi:hypothetical protein
VTLPALVTGESIENSESAGAQFQGEPNRSGRFFIDHLESGFEELSHGFFFSGLCFESDEQSNVYHCVLLKEMCCEFEWRADAAIPALLGDWRCDMTNLRSRYPSNISSRTP